MDDGRDEIPPDRLPGTPAVLGGKRFYCPVGSCAHHCPSQASGWTSLQSMRSHLNMHACGQLVDPLPQTWLHDHELVQCDVCHKVLHK
eukprot:5397371-Amphidinium_carterae.1